MTGTVSSRPAHGRWQRAAFTGPLECGPVPGMAIRQGARRQLAWPVMAPVRSRTWDTVRWLGAAWFRGWTAYVTAAGYRWRGER